jgi:hypothetical protein
MVFSSDVGNTRKGNRIHSAKETMAALESLSRNLFWKGKSQGTSGAYHDTISSCMTGLSAAIVIPMPM